MAYASRYLHLASGDLADKVVLVGPRPDWPRAMAFIEVEGDRPEKYVDVDSIQFQPAPPIEVEGDAPGAR